MKFQVTLMEQGAEPIGTTLEVNFAEMKKVSQGPQLSISVGDEAGDGSIRLPLSVLNVLMQQTMERAAARQSQGIVVPNKTILGPDGNPVQ